MSIYMVTSLKAKPTVLVCAHDAGGANLLFAWARRARRHVDIVQLMAGPASAIFENQFPEFTDWSGIDHLVCSTGWQTDFEFTTLLAAKNHNIPSIAYLDHWVNYDMRFERNGQQILPDQLWCADAKAVATVKQSALLKSIAVKNTGNYYWKDIQRAIPQRKHHSILVIHEPIRDPEVNQAALIEKCLAILLPRFNGVDVVFRVHPSGMDAFGESLLAELQSHFYCHISNGSLEEDIASSRIVIGYLSAALAMTASMGYPVFSLSGELPDYLKYFGVC